MMEKTPTLEMILGSPNSFLEKIFAQLKKDNIDVSDFEMDHICYRVATLGDYVFKKNQLDQISNLLTESNINGRSIATFKLHFPIKFKNREVYWVELPSPKEGSFYPQGFEHVEFVIKNSLANFKKSYPQIAFDEKGFSKKINPDLRIKYDGWSVKFHEHSLEYVIRYLDEDR